MTKFNEALDFLEATGNTDISTIMDCAMCSETVANFALQAYNRDRGGKAVEPKPKLSLRAHKIIEAQKLYRDVYDSDLELFNISTSIGMDPSDAIKRLTKKLAMSKSLIELAEFAKNVKKDDTPIRA